MRETVKPAARLALLLLLALCAAPAAPGQGGQGGQGGQAGQGAQGAPAVTKVEPPNWWAGHSLNPVRVMLRGRNLSGARVEAVGGGLTAGLVRTNPAGTYLFVDVSVDPAARPGPRRLRVTGPGGAAEAAFEITAPLGREGRFQGFTTDDVIYFIMPDRFSDGDQSNNDPPKSRGLYDRSRGRFYHGGDLRGVINRLPYLKDLGVTAIWINPVYDNNDRPDEQEVYPETEGGPKRPTTGYHGYGPVDFYAVEERYGDMATLRELVERAHSMGMKVIQDQVANHTGPYHPWAADQPTPTWFNGTARSHIPNNWQKWTTMNPHASYQTQRANLEGWFIDILPDFNQSDEEARRYLIQNTLWWIGMVGFDAVRMDTLPHVPRDFWRDWTAALNREYPRVNVLGELYDGNPALLAYFQKGRAGHDGVDTGIHTLYDFALFYAIRDSFAKGGPVRKLAEVLAHDWLYPNPRVLVPFLGVHDMPRFMNEQGATVEGLRLAHAFLMTTRGTPLLYYGDELAMEGGPDPDNRRDFPGGFPGDRRNAFTREGRTAAENSVFDNLRRLARLRAELPALRHGSVLHLHDAEQQTVFARVHGGQTVLAVFNNDAGPATFTFGVADTTLAEGARLADRLETVRGEARVERGTLTLTLPARSAAVFAPRAER